MIIGTELFTTYFSEVPSIGLSCGAPSKTGAGTSFVLLRLTVAVWAMLLEITASWASEVPGTLASTFSTGLSVGILAKSAGRLCPGTYVHGPEVWAALNHRPAIRT